METNGSSYLMSSDSYSENGSDYYSISDNNYIEMVGFVFNPDNQMSEYWVYLKSTSTLRTVYDELCSSYIEEKTEENNFEEEKLSTKTVEKEKNIPEHKTNNEQKENKPTQSKQKQVEKNEQL